MASNALFFAWNRAIPGREKLSATHFGEFVSYLQGLQESGTIRSFEPVFIDAHGGDVNGFFLVRGEPTKLDALVGSKEWQTHMVRAMLHLEGSGCVRAVIGEALMERMQLWSNLVPE